MKIVIADINLDFINKVSQAISQSSLSKEQIDVFHGSFSDTPDIDCMVAAGNSYGVMGGGVDKAIRDYFGFHIQDKVQSIINQSFLGELPVGSSIIVNTNDNKIPYLIYSPTMRIPKSIKGTDIPYTATWSSLCQAFRSKDSSNIETIVLPGMGTGAGGIPLNIAAHQMVLAVENFFKYQKSYNDLKTDMHTRGFKTEQYLFNLK